MRLKFTSYLKNKYGRMFAELLDIGICHRRSCFLLMLWEYLLRCREIKHIRSSLCCFATMKTQETSESSIKQKQNILWGIRFLQMNIGVNWQWESNTGQHWHWFLNFFCNYLHIVDVSIPSNCCQSIMKHDIVECDILLGHLS